jgi:hypothetical protein
MAQKNVLDKGFVRLVDHMPQVDLDTAIVQAARVSYGDGTRSSRGDRGSFTGKSTCTTSCTTSSCVSTLHAQQEIREYAEAIYALVATLGPHHHGSVSSDFRVNGMFLTGPEIDALRTGTEIASPGERTGIRGQKENSRYVIKGRCGSTFRSLARTRVELARWVLHNFPARGGRQGKGPRRGFRSAPRPQSL